MTIIGVPEALLTLNRNSLVAKSRSFPRLKAASLENTIFPKPLSPMISQSSELSMKHLLLMIWSC